MNKYEFLERLREVWESHGDISFSELINMVFHDEVYFVPDRYMIEKLESTLDKRE